MTAGEKKSIRVPCCAARNPGMLDSEKLQQETCGGCKWVWKTFLRPFRRLFFWWLKNSRCKKKKERKKIGDGLREKETIFFARKRCHAVRFWLQSLSKVNLVSMRVSLPLDNPVHKAESYVCVEVARHPCRQMTGLRLPGAGNIVRRIIGIPWPWYIVLGYGSAGWASWGSEGVSRTRGPRRCCRSVRRRA